MNVSAVLLLFVPIAGAMLSSTFIRMGQPWLSYVVGVAVGVWLTWTIVREEVSIQIRRGSDE